MENKEDNVQLLIGNYRLIQKLGLEVIRELENLGYDIEKVDLVKGIEYDQTCIIRIYTEHHIYSVLVTQSSDITIKEQYIGGSVIYRKPFKGEMWTTGYDLLHGQYDDKIWNEIKETIINEEKDNRDPIKYERFYLNEE